MTIKEELEILRGEPIQVFTGDPMDIPCIETSDAEKLCQHPVVSVHMITYNHEPYIRQAIEGVMMQKTDFEFELVIGEDCSTDKTREICFEYQKRYPDKIRVLWCDHNLYRNPHPAGGNGRRTTAHCRGEFIAFCEGDDYWIDPLKLQKQVDAMRKNPNVGLCFTASKTWLESECRFQDFNFNINGDVTIKGEEYFKHFGFLSPCPNVKLHFSMFRTATAMLRRSVLEDAMSRYAELFAFKLYLGDFRLWSAMAFRADICVLADATAVYRSQPNGAWLKTEHFVMIDCIIIAMWLMVHELGYDFLTALRTRKDVGYHIRRTLSDRSFVGNRNLYRGLRQLFNAYNISPRELFIGRVSMVCWSMMRAGVCSPWAFGLLNKIGS